ncbi:hypothetical protein [Pseudomonas kilonensis]
MEQTNREILDSFVQKTPADYQVVPLLPGRLVEEVPGYTGLLPAIAVNSNETNIAIPRWDTVSTIPGAPDLVTIQVAPYIDLSTLADEKAEDRYFDVNRPFYDRLIPNPPDPVLMEIPRTLRGAGVWLIRYKVDNDDTGVHVRSIPQLMVIDQTAPYMRPPTVPPAPQRPAGPGPFDRTWLASQPGQTGQFPIAYDAVQGLSPDDTVEVYLDDDETPIVFPGGITRVPISATTPVTIPLPLSAVLALPNGPYRLRYRLYDVVGNPSYVSRSLSLPELGTAAPPSGFGALTVDFAVPGDNLINIADVESAAGLTVRVPTYLNVQPTDAITVTLTSANGSSIPVTVPVGTSTFPVPVQFTPNNVDTLYGPLPRTGLTAVTASYVINRGGASFPPVPALVPFDVDLSFAGPGPRPPGTTPNPNLLQVQTHAVRPGGVLGPLDHLEPQDVNRPAVARVPMWTAAPTPAATVPFTITLFYGTQSYSQLVTVPPVTGFVDFPIPFSVIRALGGPNQVTSYTITSVASPNNPQYSAPQTVLVQNAILLMGAPSIVGASVRANIVSCASLVPTNTGVLRINVPGSEYLEFPGTVNIRYEGFRNDTLTGTPDIDLTKSFPVPTANAAVIGWVQDFGTATEVFNGLYPTRATLGMGSLRVTVSTQYQGSPVSSLPVSNVVRGTRPGTGAVSYYCETGVVPT